jgi:hypothetical protein
MARRIILPGFVFTLMIIEVEIEVVICHCPAKKALAAIVSLTGSPDLWFHAG